MNHPTTADKGELLPICQCGSRNVKRSKVVHDRFTCNDCHEWVRESQTSAVDSEPLCKDKAIGTAYETETEILIAAPHGYDLTEEHNCDAMGCGQWHVLHRFPKNHRSNCEQQLTTNEGQDGLTEEVFDRCITEANRSYTRHKYSIRGQIITPDDDWNWHFAHAIVRHLSSHPAPDDQQAKDAARYRKLRGMHWNDSMLCVVSEPKESVKLGCYCPSGEQLDAAIDAALSTTKQEEV